MLPCETGIFGKEMTIEPQPGRERDPGGAKAITKVGGDGDKSFDDHRGGALHLNPRELEEADMVDHDGSFHVQIIGCQTRQK